MSPSKEAENRSVRPGDEPTPKPPSILASLAPKRRRSSSYNSDFSCPSSPWSTPASSRASSPSPSSSPSASPKKLPGPKRKRDREQLVGGKLRKERIRKRNWRECLRKLRACQKQREEERRRRNRINVSNFRQNRKKKSKEMETKSRMEKETAFKIVQNLRFSLDQKLGKAK